MNDGKSERQNRLSAGAWTVRIRSWARELGFRRVGIAPPREPELARDRLLEWLGAGHQAGMAWLARDPGRRVDPEEILPGVRSILTLALPYYHPEPVPAAPGLPSISRYARGEDYHEVIGEKLHALVDRIREEIPTVTTRIACDTSPILEKAFAAAGGLGWLGKNTCLIHPDLGSWFFIGEIFLDLALVADQPVADRCGSCTRCLDACPTDAFPQAYVLDSRRCIAYRNIEHRGSMPMGWSASLGNWLVGCDICQEVCPWNRKAPIGEDPRLQPHPEMTEATAEEWVEFDDETYRAKVRNSAVGRIKPGDMRRNARAVIANREWTE